VHQPQPLDTATKIAALQRLLDLAADIKVRDSDRPGIQDMEGTRSNEH
jgi:hypothetical protein